MAKAKVPQHVCLWVRIGKIRSASEGEVRFLVDPWHMWLSKELRIDSLGGLVGKV